MALGLPSGGSAEDRTPIIKYDARAGRIFRVDRTQDGGGWKNNNVEITPVFQAVMDLERIELGWLHFPSGAAPSIVVAPFGEPMPAKPSDQHRSGFRVNMLLGQQSGGDVREMAANAQVAIKAMDALHDAYMAGRAANPGKLPVVRLAGTTSVTTTGKGENGQPVSSTNYQPVWEIVKWVERPALLGGAGAAQASAPEAPPPPPQPALAGAVGDDF